MTLTENPDRMQNVNVVVLVKQVPDTWSERKLSGSDHTLDRASADAVLDEINERAVEETLLIKEAHRGEVTAVCMGPERANEAIRKALSMGADSAVHLADEGLHGRWPPRSARWTRWIWSWRATSRPTAAAARHRRCWPSCWGCRS